MNTTTSADELTAYLKDTVAASRFELQKIKFSDQDKWMEIDGSISHVSGGFFHIIGLTSKISDEEHLMLYQPQSALTGLALCRHKGSIYVLLQARVEPGNTGIAQYGPTIQSTAANYTRQHGGKATNYLEHFYSYSGKANLISFTMQTDLGKRYFQKSKTHNYIEMEELITARPNDIWVDLETLLEVAEKDYYLNTDLRSLLALFDWDKFQYETPPNHSDFSTDLMSRYFQIKSTTFFDWKFTSLEDLKGWEKTEFGVADLHGSGVSVDLFNTVSITREVASWVQPLMRASSQGYVLMLRRVRNNTPEYLLTLTNELGIDGQITIGPTYMAYPGETVDPELQTIGTTTSAFLHSEEGGRFIKHESQYRIATIDGEIDIEDNQCWVPLADLKSILSTSNMLCIQMRVICSGLLKDLNPRSFGAKKLEHSYSANGKLETIRMSKE